MPAIVRNIFENYVKDRFDLEDCIAVNNGTSALIATLWSMDLKPEDEVITTPFTFIATSNAVIIAGAKPVFVDIDPTTLLIDPELIEAKITPNTKAIIAVHLYGRICDMDKINAIAKKHNLVVIEDTAQAFGAENQSGYAGMLSDAGTFSFYKTKNISTFEGGMICIPKDSRLDSAKIRSICDQGQTGKYHHEYIGFNFRLAEPLCLMALEQMKLHMVGVKAELGIRGPEQGHYPNVVYNQPAYQLRGINGDCPIAEQQANIIALNSLEKFNPVLLVMRPRSLPGVMESILNNSRIDTYVFEAFSEPQVCREINKYMLDLNLKYTHYIIASDDIIFDAEPMEEVLRVAEELHQKREERIVTGWCKLSINSPTSNVCSAPLRLSSGKGPSIRDYDFVPVSDIEAKTNEELFDNYLTGFAFSCIPRSIFKNYPMQTYPNKASSDHNFSYRYYSSENKSSLSNKKMLFTHLKQDENKALKSHWLKKQKVLPNIRKIV